MLTHNGNSSGFIAVFGSEFDYVWNSLRRLGVPSRDLEDLTHDVFFRVYQKFADYDRTQPVRPWLFGFAFRIASFALGSAIGAGAYALTHPAARSTHLERRAEAAAPTTVESATVFVPPSQSSPPVIPSVQAARSSAPMASNATVEHSEADGLAEQQALIDAARSAFARGEYDTALRALDTQRKRYPKSMLAEEREALLIKALVGAGRFAEAKSRGSSFAAHFPQSLLLPSVNDSLNTIP